MKITRMGWKLQEALDFVRKVQPMFKELNYHCALAGSVLNNGESNNDLDIIVMAMNNENPCDFDELTKLMKSLGAELETDPKYLDMIARKMFRTKSPDQPIDWMIYQYV